jgi:hypothetical protein
MSAVPTTPARSATKSSSRSSMVRWIVGTIGLAAIVTAVAIAVWPASAADKARADGENLGQAVGALHNATSTTEVDAALTDINAALNDTRTHAGDELASQVDEQADALNRAADGFVGSRTADDGWDQDLYQSELDYAVDDLANNADDFQNQHSEVRAAYYEGFQSGLPSDLR